MAGRTAAEELELTELGRDDRGPGRTAPGWNGGDRHTSPLARPQQVYLTGIWLALASILMFFMALTSSFIVRKGLGSDWVPIDLPPILWANTALLLVSSITIEWARRSLARDLLGVFRRWWTITTVLGLAFVIGQLVAWQQLRAAGVYLNTNPSSSFFYLLTGAHGVHLLGGIAALLYVGSRDWQGEARPGHRTAARVTTVYWHFLDALWVFLFLLLLLGR